MIKVDSVVRLSEEGRDTWVDDDHYDDHNPEDLQGVVYEIGDYRILPVHVKWSNGNNNSYDEKDLEIV